MSKIGLFTFYTGNYGAALQAFALQRYICGELNRECLIVRTRPGVRTETRLQKWILRGEIFRLGWIKRICCGKNVPKLDSETFCKLQAGTAERKKAFVRFESEYLQLDDNQNRLFSDYYRNPPDYDIYLSGSDQVWNPISCGRCNPVYYLDFVPAGRRRVSYASSFAVSEPPALSVREMKKFLLAFDRISVRETEGAVIVRRLTDTDPPVVLDPVFLLTDGT